MATVEILFIDNTMILDLVGLKSEVEDAFINAGATVSVTLKDKDGNNVSGQSWPAAMSYVAASNGVWRGVLSEVLVLTAKQKYVAYIEANAGSNRVGHWEFPVKAQVRTGVVEEDA